MPEYYSIKMRASRVFVQDDPDSEPVQEHISGAERIVLKEEIDEISKALIHRAQNHDNGVPDFINLKIQLINPERIEYIPSLPVFLVQVPDHSSAQRACRGLLQSAGISPQSIHYASDFLMNGDSQGKNLSGALVMDFSSSSIQNPDGKGIRATTMDFTPSAHHIMDDILHDHDLAHTRLKEALVLATKVAHAPGARAEVCYSDNPDYHIGYVSVTGKGYFRIPHLKPPSAKGGRVFFVQYDGFSWDVYSRYLRNTPVLIDRISPFHTDFSLDQLFSHSE
ncbi:6-carboxyhexanoate--CoA ligase [uncultured Methanospirillum sp.]|uniref:6-carboxyhexanoate--CoA ligase n=1 Tax=uncultured Methanospirillum sp. TaxID=262503 RepID=UPI0029C833DB|nr:6-carboxyhexanoate--CoA ligase [uncultured Methanospirillum sp.]